MKDHLQEIHINKKSRKEIQEFKMTKSEVPCSSKFQNLFSKVFNFKYFF